MSTIDPNAFLAACPSRGLIARLGEKWTLLLIALLSEGPTRFGRLRHRLEGVSQKMLAQSLRSLERDGLVARVLLSDRPIAVEYRLTDLGADLAPLAIALKRWAELHLRDTDAAATAYDARNRRVAGS